MYQLVDRMRLRNCNIFTVGLHASLGVYFCNNNSICKNYILSA